MVMTTKAKARASGTLITIGIAACLVTVGSAGLGSYIALAGEDGAGVVESASVQSASAAVTDEVQAPEGLTVKVDDRGIALPEGNVSAQYAVAAAAEVAERAYDHPATGRAQAVLRNSETTTAPEADYIHGLFWDVLLEVDGGSVSATIVADGGAVASSNFDPYEGSWQAFDDWNDETGEGPNFGTEAELIAFRKEVHEKYGEDYGKPLMSEEEIAKFREMKRNAAIEFAAGFANEPHAARAVELVNERNLGNGATAVSATIVTTGGSGPVDEEIQTKYYIDVTLDNGTHLFVQLGQDDQALYGYETCPTDWLTSMYG
ncbi:MULTISPECIES: hypothetical protein [Gordonibacter]|uniref:Uncharacterized protein n=1 Tax=Gordonibacter faecis TaxID=3047475 RepID=A0ABT7DNN8_9ACTN|nr:MULTISPECIES: hypothetical protein [unclassified Gordonibacter]MDJ1651164.1 hypothetical protein [Gordonibacter sp. KGMB12511]HIW77370.1 hypothetical protein [Candidatus Gordonibacter avicola]